MLPEVSDEMSPRSSGIWGIGVDWCEYWPIRRRFAEGIRWVSSWGMASGLWSLSSLISSPNSLDPWEESWEESVEASPRSDILD